MRPKVGSYKQLRVWKQAKALALDTYRVTRHFPQDERYAMTSQLRRAALGISSCIAEGNGRPTKRDYAHYVSMGYSSLLEVESTFDIAHDLGYLSDAEFKELSVAITAITFPLLALRDKLLEDPDTD